MAETKRRPNMEIYFHPCSFIQTIEQAGKTIDEMFEKEHPNVLTGLFYENDCFLIIIEDDSLDCTDITSMLYRVTQVLSIKFSVFTIPDWNFTQTFQM
jgi:hypothetical protein